MKKSQKGQDIIEFSLMLPFFILITIGIIYSGFFFSDYMTLNNLARSAAREAVVSTNVIEVSDGNGGITKKRDFQDIRNTYDKIITKDGIITSLYLYQEGTLGIDEATLPQDTSKEKKAVKVDIPMTLNKNAGFVKALYDLGIIPADTYHITYYMYDENPVT